MEEVREAGPKKFQNNFGVEELYSVTKRFSLFSGAEKVNAESRKFCAII